MALQTAEQVLTESNDTEYVRAIALCEWARIIPVPGALYRTEVVPECTSCTEIAALHDL